MELKSTEVGALLASIGAKTPAPGGGAAASLLAGIGSALLEMVLRYTEGSRKYADHANLHAEALERLTSLREEALDLAKQDVEAYETLNRLMKLDRDDPERLEHFEQAVEDAIAVPMRAMTLAEELIDWCDRLSDKTNRMLRSDLAIAAIAADAALRAAAWNVRVNIPLVKNDHRRTEVDMDIERRTNEAGMMVRRVEGACR